MIFLRAEISLEMVLKMKCKSFLQAGESGLKLAKLKMSKLPQKVFLHTSKQNTENVKDLRLKRYLPMLKTKLMKSNLKEL